MSEWTDADVEAVAEALFRTRYHESEMDPWLLLGAELGMGVMDNIARALLASGVVVPARVAEEAHEAGYHIGYREGRDEAETRDLSFDELTDRAERAEADLSRLRSAVEALVSSWTSDWGLPATAWSPEMRQQMRDGETLAVLLTEGRDRAGEGAGS